MFGKEESDEDEDEEEEEEEETPAPKSRKQDKLFEEAKEFLKSELITLGDFRKLPLNEMKQFILKLQQQKDFYIDFNKKCNTTEAVEKYKQILNRVLKPQQQIKGKGLFDVDSVDKRTQKAKHYYPLGRRIINKSRLIGDNIVMLKQSSGNGISNYPTHSVSPKLAKVLVKMTDSSFPTFDEVAELEDMDKKHLFKLCKECHLLNKVNLPKMTDYEKELHNFYVMLGEITAGNQNKNGEFNNWIKNINTVKYLNL